MKRLLVASLLATACAHLGDSVQGPQGKLHVDDGGSGRGVPVLFVHGNGANLNQWRYQLDHVRKDRRAVALDLRGMGESDVARNSDYSIAAMTDDIQAVVDALRLSRFVIVGHSYGGAVVAAYAAKHPNRVAGVVYADSAGNVTTPADAASRFLSAIRKDKDAVVNGWFAPILANASDAVKSEVLTSVHNTNTDAFASALDGLRSVDTAVNVEAYHGPKIAIAAAPLERPTSLHKLVLSLRVVKMEGVSHWLMLDKPDEFNRILDGFLAEVDSGERASRPQ